MNFNSIGDVLIYIVVAAVPFLVGRIWGSWKSSLIVGILANVFFYLFLTRFSTLYLILAVLTVIGGLLFNFFHKQYRDPAFKKAVNDDLERYEKRDKEKQARKELKEQNRVKIECPNCGSTEINFVDNNGKQFSIGKALAGGLLAGGVGTLAGFTGKKGKTNRWHCKNCGTSFNK